MKNCSVGLPVENFISRQAQEIIFFSQKNINNHPVVFFKYLAINKKSTQKHHGLLLHKKLFFAEHISEKLEKETKSMNPLRRLSLTLPHSFLLIIYKSFVRPQLDYGGTVYNQLNNSLLSEKINLCNVMQLEQ